MQLSLGPAAYRPIGKVKVSQQGEPMSSSAEQKKTENLWGSGAKPPKADDKAAAKHLLNLITLNNIT